MRDEPPVLGPAALSLLDGALDRPVLQPYACRRKTGDNLKMAQRAHWVFVQIGCLLSILLISLNAAAQPGDPPLEIYVHAPSENGEQSLVVIYHANGTFELNGTNHAEHRGFGGRNPKYRHTGHWWRTADGKFCWQTDPSRSGRTYGQVCKKAGGLIGRARVDASGNLYIASPKTE